MPELPEVETFVRGLRAVIGRTIERADVIDPKLELAPSALAGRRIASIDRRGKHIVFSFGGGDRLTIHLRMSGRLRLDRSEAEVPYTRLILHLDSKEQVYFVDPRRLGTACLGGFATETLGVEPLSGAFTPACLATLVAASRAPIKPLLLDQRRIAGLGNIYAAESLWRAGVDPHRPSNGLTDVQVAALHESIVAVLTEALDGRGTTLGASVSDYRPGPGTAGEFQNRLYVYGREGEDCSRCGWTIERSIQQGRSTYYCPNCQR
jgi:formamidopyrimidine-DNA glycosylase